MKILVCVKPIPDIQTGLHLNPERTGIEIPETAAYRMNRSDECAVEEAVKIKEQRAGSTVDILSVCAETEESILRRAMGMGGDHGIVIRKKTEAYLSPAALSAFLAEAVRGRGYDLILTGMMSEDEMNAQTGQMLAARLGIPCAAGAVEISFSEPPHAVEVLREKEGGVRESLSLALPALLTVQTGISRPRYPSLSAVLRAAGRDLEILSPSGDSADDQQIVSVAPAARMRQAVRLEGSVAEQAAQLYDTLYEREMLK